MRAPETAPPVWDTSVLSKAPPALREHDRYRAQGSLGVVTAAPVMEEWIYGAHRKASSRSSRRRWEMVLVWIGEQLGDGRIKVLPYGLAEARLTAALRLQLPAPALAQDIRIASCAWLSDRPVLTSNKRDFVRIAAAIERLGWGGPLRVEAA